MIPMFCDTLYKPGRKKPCSIVGQRQVLGSTKLMLGFSSLVLRMILSVWAVGSEVG